MWIKNSFQNVNHDYRLKIMHIVSVMDSANFKKKFQTGSPPFLGGELWENEFFFIRIPLPFPMFFRQSSQNYIRSPLIPGRGAMGKWGFLPEFLDILVFMFHVKSFHCGTDYADNLMIVKLNFNVINTCFIILMD